MTPTRFGAPLLMCAAALLGAALPAPSLADALTERLAAASPSDGETVFRRCRACHTIDEGGRARQGPNLWGVVGRAVAARDDYDKYSEAMIGHGGVWTPERLDEYLADPRAVVPRTTMRFNGLPDERDRADLIAFLNANGPSPLNLGAAPGADDAADETPEDFGLLFVAPGVEDTFYICTACHSERIIAQQGFTRAHWDELIDTMVEEQGMEELPAEERTMILDYLAEHYNTDRPNFPY